MIKISLKEEILYNYFFCCFTLERCAATLLICASILSLCSCSILISSRRTFSLKSGKYLVFKLSCTNWLNQPCGLIWSRALTMRVLFVSRLTPLIFSLYTLFFFSTFIFCIAIELLIFHVGLW